MTSSGIKRSIEPKTMTCEITIWLFEFIKNHNDFKFREPPILVFWRKKNQN